MQRRTSADKELILGSAEHGPTCQASFLSDCRAALPRRGAWYSGKEMSQDAEAVRSTTLAIALNFQGGPEYALRARTNTQFIEDCYNGILRRGALAPEIQGWANLLTAGASRTEVLTGFVNSAEFHARIDQVIAAGPYTP